MIPNYPVTVYFPTETAPQFLQKAIPFSRSLLSLLPVKSSSTRPCDKFSLLSEPSGPPQLVTISDVTSTGINVSWGPVPTDDRNGIILGYKLNYRALSNGGIVSEFLNISSKQQDEGGAKTLQTLNEFTNYSIDVLAFTIIGDGPRSVPKFLRTQEDSKLN